jgi:hypothetical protein
MITTLVPKNEIYGEIGIFKGEFSKILLSELNPKQLVLFDLFEGLVGSGNKDGNCFETVNLSNEFLRLQSELLLQPVKFEKGDSSILLNNYPNNYFSMIYIDGDHTYEGTKKDIMVAFNKVKNGGWIMGHDYEMNMEKAHTFYQFGVKQAVDEFCLSYGQVITAKALDGCVSFAIKVNKS